MRNSQLYFRIIVSVRCNQIKQVVFSAWFIWGKAFLPKFDGNLTSGEKNNVIFESIMLTSLDF